MTTDRGVVRQIAWSEVFPWLILLRTFRIAISPSLLALATLATLLSPVGERLARVIFLWEKVEGEWGFRNPRPGNPLEASLPPAVLEYLPGAPTGLVEPFLRLADPVYSLMQADLSLGAAAYYAFSFLWSLAIWAFVGGVITRSALVRLTLGEPPGILATLKFAGQRYLWYFLAPLFPLLGIVIIAAPIALLGLPLWLHLGIGSILAALLWLLVIIASVGAMWLVAGLLFGWPLLWPAISSQRDASPFEAFSESYSYVYGKPLHYLFYVIVAATFGALCLAVVNGAALVVLEFAWWALSWGAGREAVEKLRDLVDLILRGGDIPDDRNRLEVIGAGGVALTVGLVQTIVIAYTFSYLWTVASAIYLLLRFDHDEKELDEIYIPPEQPAAPVVQGRGASEGSSVAEHVPSEQPSPPPPPASPPSIDAGPLPLE